MIKAFTELEGSNIQDTLSDKMTGDSKLQTILHYTQALSQFHLHFPDAVTKHLNDKGVTCLLILPDMFTYNLSENGPLLESLFSHLHLAVAETNHVYLSLIPKYKRLFSHFGYKCNFDIISNMNLKEAVYKAESREKFENIMWIQQTANERKNQAIINKQLKKYYEQITI